MKHKRFFMWGRFAISIVFMLMLGGCPALQMLTGGVNPFSQFLGMPGGPKTDLDSPKGPEIEIEKLTIMAQPEANGGSPLWVALVIIYKNGPLDAVMGMDAKTFEHKWVQLMRDNPQRIEVFQWEIPPSMVLPAMPINKTGSKPIAGFIFAAYENGGTNRLQLATGTHIRLILKPTEPWYEVVNE